MSFLFSASTCKPPKVTNTSIIPLCLHPHFSLYRYKRYEVGSKKPSLSRDVVNTAVQGHIGECHPLQVVPAGKHGWADFKAHTQGWEGVDKRCCPYGTIANIFWHGAQVTYCPLHPLHVTLPSFHHPFHPLLHQFWNFIAQLHCSSLVLLRQGFLPVIHDLNVCEVERISWIEPRLPLYLKPAPSSRLKGDNIATSMSMDRGSDHGEC
mmetsp:Transcript_6812/g.14278  ORF Transcript_6812/g.14278 Transcript_6812/m.14278 type:complete len:208 (-) Transcript_6812:771-1394(-)